MENHAAASRFNWWFWPAIFAAEFVLVRIIGLFPEMVERWYSKGLYPVISSLERMLFGWIPFSIGDFGYGILLVFVLRTLWKWKRGWRFTWQLRTSRIFRLLAILYFAFHFCWALNYHRVRLHEKLGLQKDYTAEELFTFTQRLIVFTNGLQLDITKDPDSIVRVPYSRDSVFEKAFAAYQVLGAKDPQFALDGLSAKKSLYSLPLSYMGFSGYLNPFTNEAQVNALGPLYSYGGTSCHEMAHQVGFASENEANFVGYLAAIHSEDAYLQYSGYTLALRYCLRSMQAYDAPRYRQLLAQVNPGIRKNFEESRRYSEKYSTFLEDVFEYVYDHFLKFNSQDDGMESYNRFVDLLVNYYATREL